MYAYSTNGTPQIIILPEKDALLPRVTLHFIFPLLQTVPIHVVHLFLAVRAYVQKWPDLFLLSVVCLAPLPHPFVLVDRVATVASWAVIKAENCFIIACISVSSLLVLVSTTLVT